MSHATLRYLYCDGKECPLRGEAYDCAPTPNAAIDDQRRSARFNGWLVSQPEGKDYCPECRAKSKEPPNDR